MNWRIACGVLFVALAAVCALAAFVLMATCHPVGAVVLGIFAALLLAVGVGVVCADG